jgi:hypothetical protein
VTKSGVVWPLRVGSGFLLLAALLGNWLVAVVVAALTTAAGLWLTLRAGDEAVRGMRDREAADEAVVKVHCVAPALAGGVGALLHGPLGVVIPGSGQTLWPWRGAVITVALTSLVFAVSSLIDWCITKPRMSGNGDLERVPCRTSTNADWHFVTRLWVGHRTVAFMVGRAGAVVALGFIAAGVFRPSIPAQAIAAIGAVSAAIVGFVLNRLAPVISLVTNPPMQVGDKILLAEEYGTGVTARPRYYVVDVAFEGVKLLQLRETSDMPSGNDPQRTHDRALSLDNVARLLRGRDKYTGCRLRCRGVNPYCPLEQGDPIPPAPTAGSPPPGQPASGTP